MKKMDVEIPATHTLQGTLTIPEKKENVPAILFLSGSGKGDRNGNLKEKNLNMNMYKELAEHLTDAGFITLRFDKRGTGGSQGDFLHTGMWDLVEDGQSAISFLKTVPEVDQEKIIILGHSEGCILGVAIGARMPVAGLILVSGAGDRLEESMKYQREQMYEELESSKGLKGVLAKWMNIREKGEKDASKYLNKALESDHDTMRYKLVTHNAKWLREHLQYDVLGDYQKITCPILAVTGSKDVQTIPESVEKVKELVPKSDLVETHIIKDMNHVLKMQEKDRSMTNLMKIYKELQEEPVAEELKSTITNWLQAVYLDA